MAIAYIGSTSIQASSGSVSQAVTVPTGTNYAVIFYGGWSSTVRTVSALSLGGTPASNIYTRANADDAQDSYIYGVATSEGSKTLAFTMSGAMTEGGIVQIAFLSGVDTTNPVVATNFAEAIASAVNGATWTNMTSVVDGIGLVFATGYNTENTLTITAQSQTQIFNSTYNSDNYASGYKLTAATTTTLGITVGGAQRYWSAIVVTLRPSSGAQTHNYTGSGGVATGGTAALKRAFANQASGGITTGGAASASKASGNSYIASGGITTGGAAALKRTQVSTASGGISTGGTGGLKLVKTVSGAGGVATGGVAALKRAFARSASGGVATGGAAPFKLIKTATASGGLTTGGAATLKRTQATTATGGIVTGGAATASKSSPGQNSHAASGGVATGGAATLKRTQTAVGAGGIATGGAATLKRSFAQLASGGLSTGGAAVLKRIRAYLASGGLTTGGAASVTLTAGAFSYAASGGIATGGSASLRILLHYLASGGVTIGGAASAYAWSSVMVLPHGDPAFARLSSVAAMERITPLARVA